MKRSILPLLFITLIMGSCSSVKERNYIVSKKQHAVAELKADIDAAYNTLKEGHPGIYWYISKDKLDHKFDSLKNTITQPMGSVALYRKLAPLITQIHCGHTQMVLVAPKLNKAEQAAAKKRGTKPLDQLQYTLLNNKLYILKNKGTANPLLKAGTEITQIGNVPVAQLLDTLSRIVPSDGYNTTHIAAVLDRNFPSFYRAYYPSKDTLSFTLKVNDSLKVVDIALLKKKEEKKKDSTSTKQVSTQAKEKQRQEAENKRKLRYKGLDENNKPILDLNFIGTDSSTAYMKVKSFSGNFIDHKRFFKESFAEIAKRKPKVLVIDLRNNGGGKLSASSDLFTYLIDSSQKFVQKAPLNKRWYSFSKHADGRFITFINGLFFTKGNEHDGYYTNLRGNNPLPPKTDHYNGKVYVLINGYTFSASTLLSANLAALKRVTFVGEEAGGGYNQCTAGRIPLVEMPNSKLKLRLGLMRIAPNTHRNLEGRGIFPDIPVNRNLQDIIEGKDTELNTVLNDIKAHEGKPSANK